MVTTFRASEAFAGALELTGKATLVALINRCIGAVIPVGLSLLHI